MLPFLSWPIRRFTTSAIPCYVAVGLAVLSATGCTGPRTKILADAEYPARPSIYPIEIFVGELSTPHEEIAIIESEAFPFDDAVTREAQLEQLRERAREVGGDAVEGLRILVKRAEGFIADERTPFPSLRQGDYPLYFMRGRAVIYSTSLLDLPLEEGEVGGLEAEPVDGEMTLEGDAAEEGMEAPDAAPEEAQPEIYEFDPDEADRIEDEDREEEPDGLESIRMPGLEAYEG